MKQFVISLPLLTVMLMTGIAEAQDLTEPARTITLTIDQLIRFGYDGRVPDKTRQPIASKEDALTFIRKIAGLNDPGLTAIQGDINHFIAKTDAKENDRFAVIMIRHPLNLARLFADDPPGRVTIKGRYDTESDKKKELGDLIAMIDERIASVESRAKSVPAGSSKVVFDPSLLSAALVRELNELRTLRDNSNAQLAPQEKKIADLRAAFIRLSSEIIEEEKLESLTLDYYNNEWTDYLLNVDRVLYVLVGGLNDIQKGKLEIDNKPSSFQTSLNDLIQIGSSVLVGASIPGVELKDRIPVTFLLVKPKKIKAPATLQFRIDDKDKKITSDIHEKVRFGLQLGFSAAYLSRKNFTLNAQNQLTIKLDEAKKNELKSNLVAFLEIIPWGRDIDRLEPILSKNKDVKFFDMNRLALIAGLRFSKDPLQSMYGGVSYALSKTVSLDLGLSFNRTAKEVTNLPVGINATLDYLKDNADRELSTRFFFGLSFSPIFLGKSLGIVK